VELPNTLGMSQYADGGVMASKPYIASGKYIQKMSNRRRNAQPFANNLLCSERNQKEKPCTEPDYKPNSKPSARLIPLPNAGNGRGKSATADAGVL
jgi:hypothetical protein